jgi:two-component system cell cycle sensor histidine kinase/response regulator CckA
MSTPLRVLIIEDNEDDAALTLRELRRGGYAPAYERVETPEAMRAALEKQPWDIILADYTMPYFNAPAALEVLKEKELDVPFIIVSGSIGEDIAVAAMKAGTNDYLIKGNLARLVPAVERELREAARRQEHKRVEAQLLQSQKMEVVGRLAGGVAHDFNNLLTVILGYSELAEEMLNQDDVALAYLRNVGQAAERAAGLTRQLLAFARQQVIEPKVIHINDLILNLDKLLRRLIGEDIELVTLPAPNLGQVKVDPGQIEQVLVNLAVNARDAMPEGGKLTIETAPAILDEEYARQHAEVAPGEYIMLAVSDTGIGMDETIQAHVFEPFFTTKEPGKGTGLGLATCYGIIKQSNGYIWLYSEPGRGTTFKIYLPRVEDTVVSPQRDTRSTTPYGTETILFVEDEPMVRDISVQALRMQGYTVLEAVNGHEALRVAEEYEGDIHLLVTDVVMPQMGGTELAKRLPATYPDIKILFTSGYTDKAIVHHNVLAPGIAFLQKPFTPGTLTSKVREALDA